jgi:thiamine phosphate synthase YjbQ (UPF0047 family)
MKSHTEYLVFETKKRKEMVHITDQVEQVVRRSGVKDGLCFVSPMHITAAIYVNDLENGLIEDIGKWLEELAPARPDYKHHQTGEDNGDAHLKALPRIFLYVALDTSAYAAFFTESRMRLIDSNKLNRKSGSCCTMKARCP